MRTTSQRSGCCFLFQRKTPLTPAVAVSDPRNCGGPGKDASPQHHYRQATETSPAHSMATNSQFSAKWLHSHALHIHQRTRWLGYFIAISRAHVFQEVAVCGCVGECLGRSVEVLAVQPFISDVATHCQSQVLILHLDCDLAPTQPQGCS